MKRKVISLYIKIYSPNGDLISADNDHSGQNTINKILSHKGDNLISGYKIKFTSGLEYGSLPDNVKNIKINHVDTFPMKSNFFSKLCTFDDFVFCTEVGNPYLIFDRACCLANVGWTLYFLDKEDYHLNFDSVQEDNLDFLEEHKGVVLSKDL